MIIISPLQAYFSIFLLQVIEEKILALFFSLISYISIHSIQSEKVTKQLGLYPRLRVRHIYRWHEITVR